MTVTRVCSHELGHLNIVALECLVGLHELRLDTNRAIAALDHHLVVSEGVQKHGCLGGTLERAVVATSALVWNLIGVDDKPGYVADLLLELGQEGEVDPAMDLLRVLADYLLTDQAEVAGVAFAIGPNMESLTLFKGDSETLRIRICIGSRAAHLLDQGLLNLRVLHDLVPFALDVLGVLELVREADGAGHALKPVLGVEFVFVCFFFFHLGCLSGDNWLRLDHLFRLFLNGRESGSLPLILFGF